VDQSIELDELVEHWTLLDDEQGLVFGKGGPGKLGFVLLLKFYVRNGRFPRGRGELPDAAVRFVANQVRVPAADLGLYEWTGRTIERHRAQIRTYLGFRECSIEDADKLAAWLASEVCEAERQHDRVREQLLIRCRTERIEPPTSGRIDRIARSALRQAEVTLSCRLAGRLSPATIGRLEDLVASEVDEDSEDRAGGFSTRTQRGAVRGSSTIGPGSTLMTPSPAASSSAAYAGSCRSRTTTTWPVFGSMLTEVTPVRSPARPLAGWVSRTQRNQRIPTSAGTGSGISVMSLRLSEATLRRDE